jgi:hypothetical protein
LDDELIRPAALLAAQISVCLLRRRLLRHRLLRRRLLRRRLLRRRLLRDRLPVVLTTGFQVHCLRD